MPDRKQAAQASLQALSEAYSAGLGERLENIAQCWAQLEQAPDKHNKHHRELHRMVHSLSGSAGTFGYQRLSEAARGLEQILSEPESAGAPRGSARAADIEARLAELRAIADSGPDAIKTKELKPSGARVRRDMGRVYLIEDDPAQARETVMQLSAYGWEVSTFVNASLAREALRDTLPAAIVVDQVLPEGDLAGAELIRQVGELAEYKIPRILVSSRWDWPSRLAAAEAGADAYLVKPLDYIELAETLDKLAEKVDREPYRVLIVEDTAILAERYAQVLGAAGMSAMAITEPSRMLDALTEFKPELILMDLYMPDCSGIDAARVIRQDPEYLSVPIVFLSSEAARDRQLAAMEIGADDFLQKPIDDDQLVAAVKIRTERFRSLAEQIHQDSLTGLLNHISFKLQLETEMSRSIRSGSPLTFAMLDIDHFKRVNDNYGHPVGDRVIRSVATLLTKRLRKSDLIGRYGGEEFAVVMNDTALEEGIAVLEEIRKLFSHIVYSTGEEEFSCTISIGVATAAGQYSAGDLINAADSALYEAKRKGRNQVCSTRFPPHQPLHSGYGS